MPANQTKKPTYYQQIHSAQRNLTICKRVHRTVKAVIGYYLSRTNHRHQLAWPTQTTIAEDLGISLKTVRRAFAAAMEVQALEVVFYSIQEAQRAGVPARAQHDQRINFVRPLLAWAGFTELAIPDDQAKLILRHVRSHRGIKEDCIERPDTAVNVDRTSRVKISVRAWTGLTAQPMGSATVLANHTIAG